MDDAHLWGIGAVFVLAGAVKGITGMGLPTVAVSLLGLWMAPLAAAALLVAPSLATNVAQCRGPHFGALLRRLWPAWLALAAVTVWAPDPARLISGLAALTGRAGGHSDGGLDARQLLGAVLVAYGLWGLWRPALPDWSPLPAPRAGLLAAVVGALTGLVTAATAVFVVPLVPYLQTLRLDKAAMVQALGLSFSIATVALALRLGALQGAASFWSGATLVALLAAFAGLGLGARLRARLSGPGFQRTLFLVFIGLGLANLWRSG